MPSYKDSKDSTDAKETRIIPTNYKLKYNTVTENIASSLSLYAAFMHLAFIHSVSDWEMVSKIGPQVSQFNYECKYIIATEYNFIVH